MGLYLLDIDYNSDSIRYCNEIDITVDKGSSIYANSYIKSYNQVSYRWPTLLTVAIL